MSVKKNFSTHSGSRSNNLETDTRGGDLAVVETAMYATKREVEVTDEMLEEAIVLSPEITSIDVMMPEDERKLLEKNLNLYGDVEKVQKLLNDAKKNKLIGEDLKTLELVGKTGDFSDRLFNLLMNEDNLEVLEQYIQRKFNEGDIAKAYKEVGLLNKAMLDARETMLQKIRSSGKSGKTARIALKFTNDSGEDFSLGAEIQQ